MAGPAPRALAISVVVPTRNRARRLEALLESLERQTAPPGSFEVIIVDDGSGDSTPQVLAAARDRAGVALTTLANRVGLGPAAARNRGWRAASAPLIAFIDDDCVAEAAWLESCLRAAAGAEPGTVIQGLTLPDPRELQLLGPFARTREIHPPTLWFETCNIIYERDLLERVGGFDERFGDLGEDTDLGWRALEAGAGLEAAPQLLVHHAVDVVGVRGILREAVRGSDAVFAFKRHPDLRRRGTLLGVFWHGSHAVALLAAVGAVASLRRRSAALLAAPYVADLIRRARARRGGATSVAWLPVCDLLEISTAIRGSIRHRVLIL